MAKKEELSWAENLSQKRFAVLSFFRLATMPSGDDGSDRVNLVENEAIIIQVDDPTKVTTSRQIAVGSANNNGVEKWCACILGCLGVLTTIVGMILIFGMFNCLPYNDQNVTVPEICETPACYKIAGELLSFMDKSAAPCDDFYQHACGGWIKLHPATIHDADNTTSVLTEVTKHNTKLIREILESHETLDGAGEKAKHFYVSCLKKKQMDLDEKSSLDWISVKEDTTDGNDDDVWDGDEEWLELTRLEKTFTNLRSRVKPFLEMKDKNESISLTCVTLTQTFFQDVTARLFATRTYGVEKIEKVRFMLDEVSDIYQQKVAQLSWMDDATKAYLMSKLANTSYQLGYPASIMDTKQEIENYEHVTVSPDAVSYSDNVNSLEIHNILNYLNEENSEIEFVAEANAVYQYWKDVLYIPAGITVEPFISLEYPDIIIYAKFAITLGHEYTHAFDEYLRGAWGNHGIKPNGVSPSAYATFDKISKCLQKQYDHFPIVNSSVAVNGTSTWDENLADVLGLDIALSMFQEKYAKNYLPLPGLEFVDFRQIFFVAAAQVECRSFSGEQARERILKEFFEQESHSPNSIRVLGQMANNDEFSNAFNCKVGSRYNPREKCRVFY